jgi:signal transduction histidine kinase
MRVVRGSPLGLLFAALAVLATVLVGGRAECQIASWSIDFDDPAEPGRWHFDPALIKQPGQPPDQLHWQRVPRNASHPAEGSVLEFYANAQLSVQTFFTVYRAFPPEFQPNPDNDLVLEWDWLVGDTDKSDAVTLGVTEFICYGFVSHTRSTIGWSVMFDTPDRWHHHRDVLQRSGCSVHGTQSNLPPGIELDILSPVRQVVKLASLKVEEWPRGHFPADPWTLPHRPPPPERPFEELPVDHLERATAGALEDLDGDGLPELLALERRGYAHLYRNDGGAFSAEITGPAGLAVPTMGTGAMFLDLGGDRQADLVLTSEFDVPRLFENLGDLRFRERPPPGDQYLSFWYGAAAADVDRDGRTDLLFVSPSALPFLFLRNRGGWDFRPEPLLDARQLLQQGEVNFSASFADYDEDGWPDLFVGREYLFRNVSGRFELQSKPWTRPDRAQTEGAVWGDFNGDGRVDLLVLRDQTEPLVGPTRLLAGRGDGSFVDVTERSGLPHLESAEVALAEDFNDDGNLDLYVCQRDRPKYLLLGDGHGHFEDATERSGFADGGGCDAAVAADLDGDGGMDVVIFRYGAPPALLFNKLSRGHFLGVVVAGEPPATDAIGARVRLLQPGTGKQLGVRWVRRGQGFGAVGPAELRFGLGPRLQADVEVRFPDGRIRVLRGVRADATILVREDAGTFASIVGSRLAEARFPLVRSYRRQLARRPLLGYLIAALAFLVATALASRVVLWPAALLCLAAGAVATLLLGAAPGQGLQGSAPGLWLAGGLAGALVPWGVRGLRRVARRPQRESPTGVLLHEDLIRFTHDFRHAGIAARALLSIHNRAQNLFVDGQVHQPFLATLHELAGRYPHEIGSRLTQLLSLARAAFPDLAEAAHLTRLVKNLENLMVELTGLGEDPIVLGAWRDQLLPSLVETQEALSHLLKQLDVLCSCDATTVLQEGCRLYANRLREEGIELCFVGAVSGGSVQVLITAESLLWVLDNLFSNSLAALSGRPDPRVEVALLQRERDVAIRFLDNGPGVPPEMAEKIFHYGVTTRGTGRGYGLSRSREILGHFGGGLTLAESTEGACFLISLKSVAG